MADVRAHGHFIHQVITGDVGGREVDDIADTGLGYAEVKALATGNSLILEKARVDNKVARLGRLRQAHDRGQTALGRTIRTNHSTAGRLEEAISGIEGSVDPAHLHDYLDEFVFGFNRRTSRSRGLVFRRVLELAVTHEPVRYRELVLNPEPKKRPSPSPGGRGHPPQSRASSSQPAMAS